MSEGILIALIGVAGAVIGAAITGSAAIIAASIKGREQNINVGTSCGMLILSAAVGAAVGLVLGAAFGVMLIRQIMPTPTPPPTTVQELTPPPTISSVPVQPTKRTVNPTATALPPSSCSVLIVDGIPSTSGKTVRNSATWETLQKQWGRSESTTTSVDELCSRTGNQVHVYLGWWDADWLEDKGGMTVQQAKQLIRDSPRQPAIVVPWYP